MIHQDLDWWFQYHKPDNHPDGSAVVQERYETIRQAGRTFASVILTNTPSCADQEAAIRKVREAVYTANAAVACEGR
jgi:hypothetical protein